MQPQLFNREGHDEIYKDQVNHSPKLIMGGFTVDVSSVLQDAGVCVITESWILLLHKLWQRLIPWGRGTVAGRGCKAGSKCSLHFWLFFHLACVPCFRGKAQR